MFSPALGPIQQWMQRVSWFLSVRGAGELIDWGMKVTFHIPLMLRLMGGVIHLLHLYALWYGLRQLYSVEIQ
jgi:hypothetical protein